MDACFGGEGPHLTHCTCNNPARSFRICCQTKTLRLSPSHAEGKPRSSLLGAGVRPAPPGSPHSCHLPWLLLLPIDFLGEPYRWQQQAHLAAVHFSLMMASFPWDLPVSTPFPLVHGPNVTTPKELFPDVPHHRIFPSSPLPAYLDLCVFTHFLAVDTV